MSGTDCAAALLYLQNKAAEAAFNARTPEALLAAQQDIVEGAQRLEERCRIAGADAETTACVREYRQAAEAALARLQAEASGLPRGGRLLGRRHHR